LIERTTTGTRMMSSPVENEPAWCVAQAHGGFEGFAKEMLKQEMGVDAFVPMTRRVQQIKGAVREFTRPLIPGYIFIPLNLAIEGWQNVNSVRGIIRLIYRAPERPARVPLVEMTRLFDMVDAEGFMKQAEEPVAADLRGKRLRVTEGPFATFEGICQWSSRDRVVVLLQMLGQERPVPIGRGHVEAAG
jgi:transcriptional antiterminator RfaH